MDLSNQSLLLDLQWKLIFSEERSIVFRADMILYMDKSNVHCEVNHARYDSTISHIP